MGGVLEFIQSMGGSDVESGERKKRREQDQPTTSDVRCNDPGQGWDIAALQVLTRPLFDAIPYLLVSSMGTDEETSDATFGGSGGNVSAEYALWLTMDVLVWLLRCGPETVSGGKSEERIPDDAEKVLSCVQRNPSPQTRRVKHTHTHASQLSVVLMPCSVMTSISYGADLCAGRMIIPMLMLNASCTDVLQNICNPALKHHITILTSAVGGNRPTTLERDDEHLIDYDVLCAGDVIFQTMLMLNASRVVLLTCGQACCFKVNTCVARLFHSSPSCTQ